MPSVTKENYLKAIFNLMDENHEVNLSMLSKELSVSIVAVNNMVKKLENEGYIEYSKYQPLKVLSKGKLIASKIVRNHRLTEMFLVDKMGIGWEEVHDIAEQIEHIDSDVFFDRMDELLGNPKIDPHGSPIPDKAGNIKDVEYDLLSDIESSCKVTLKALANSSNSFIVYLNSRKLELGTQIYVHSKEAYDGSMLVSFLEEKSVMLSKEVCNGLYVQKTME